MIFFKKKEMSNEQKLKRAIRMGNILMKVKLVSMWIFGLFAGASWMFNVIEGSKLYASMEDSSKWTIYNTDRAQAKAESKEESKEEVKVEEKKESTVYDLVDYIFMKESSRGKNNYSKCEAIGKFNRYGYGIPGNGKYICFEEDDDRKAVIGWALQRQAEGMDIYTSACYYNTGVKTSNCEYNEALKEMAR